MCDAETLNMLYNILDLYIVGSRIEGGPRAINEASLTQTPYILQMWDCAIYMSSRQYI